jgi:hypothetical protein
MSDLPAQTFVQRHERALLAGRWFSGGFNGDFGFLREWVQAFRLAVGVHGEGVSRSNDLFAMIHSIARASISYTPPNRCHDLLPVHV